MWKAGGFRFIEEGRGWMIEVAVRSGSGEGEKLFKLGMLSHHGCRYVPDNSETPPGLVLYMQLYDIFSTSSYFVRTNIDS